MKDISKERISEMFFNGYGKGYSHMIVYLDCFDYEYGFIYVKRGTSVKSVISNIKSGGDLFSISEVYSYDMELSLQLNEARAYHIEVGEVNTFKKRIEEALFYAKEKHEGQFRIGGEQYIVHPINVSNYVRKFSGNSSNLELLIISALLHDVIEDTDVTYQDIDSKFGENVSKLVMEVSASEDEKKSVGKCEYWKRKTIMMSDDALIIKLCDILDNVSSLRKTDDNFRFKCVCEKLDILDNLVNNRNLMNVHKEIVLAIYSEIVNICNEYPELDNKSGLKVRVMRKALC